MIVYKEIINKLAEKGYTPSVIHREQLIPDSVMHRIRTGTPINTVTVDKLCQILECQPGDILEYKKSEGN